MYSDTQIHIFTHTYECVRLSANKNGCLVFALKLPYLYMLLHGNFGNISSRIVSHGIAGNITRLTSVQDLRDALTRYLPSHKRGTCIYTSVYINQKQQAASSKQLESSIQMLQSALLRMQTAGGTCTATGRKQPPASIAGQQLLFKLVRKSKDSSATACKLQPFSVRHHQG